MEQTTTTKLRSPRPKLSLIIPYRPPLSFSSPPTLLSTSQTNQTKPLTYLSSLTPQAPTTCLPPPSTIYPSLPTLNSCLQCYLAGLKCSFTTSAHILPPRMRLHPRHARPDNNCCVRCKRNGEDFCVRRTDVDEEGRAEEYEYSADGVCERDLNEKVNRLLEEREERGRRARRALPVASEPWRERINPGRWVWKTEKEGEDREDSSGTGESSLAGAGTIEGVTCLNGLL